MFFSELSVKFSSILPFMSSTEFLWAAFHNDSHQARARSCSRGVRALLPTRGSRISVRRRFPPHRIRGCRSGSHPSHCVHPAQVVCEGVINMPSQ